MPEMGPSGSEGGVVLITPSLPLSCAQRNLTTAASGRFLCVQIAWAAIRMHPA